MELLGFLWVILLEFRQHAGKNFEAEVVFVVESIGSALEDSYAVVESFNESERYFVRRGAVAGDAVPMRLDHPSEFLVWLESLPAQRRLPFLEEEARVRWIGEVPKLSELLLQQVGLVKPTVGFEEYLE